MRIWLVSTLLIGIISIGFSTVHATDEQRQAYDKMVEESVKEANHFLWVEHWNDGEQMEGYLKSSRFGVLLGAIGVLGESNQLLRLETEDFDGS